MDAPSLHQAAHCRDRASGAGRPVDFPLSLLQRGPASPYISRSGHADFRGHPSAATNETTQLCPKDQKTTFWYKTTAISTCYLVSPAGGEAALLAWFFTMSLPKGNICFYLSISEDKYVSGNKNKIHLHRVCTLTLILAEMVEQLPIQVTNPVI